MFHWFSITSPFNVRSYSKITLKELEDQGRVPKYFHLYDHIDMKEEHLKNKTDWWKKMSQTTGNVQ